MTLEKACGPLVVIAPEAPWPPNHGARVDILNRWRQLQALGWSLILVTWCGKGEDCADADLELAQIFERIYWLGKPDGIVGIFDRLAGLLWHSPHVWVRRIRTNQLSALTISLQGRRPVGIVLDSLYGALAARSLAQTLNLPLLHRAHNIEHLYMSKQARSARGVKRKLALWVASWHLRRLETEIRHEVNWTFDISQSDLMFWRARGFDHGSWLPPIVCSLPAAKISWQDRPYDVLYLGNLHTPNNVAGLDWFFKLVLPKLHNLRPNLRVAVAGSLPSAYVRSLISASPNVTLVANPENVDYVRAQGRILINPVLEGSGVNVKSVEMLFTDSPIVTTRAGVQGLAAEAKVAFHVTDDPIEFAASIDEALRRGPVADLARAQARALFGSRTVNDLSDQLLALTGRQK